MQSVNPTKHTLLLATLNPGKIKEFHALFAEYPYELKSLIDYKDTPVEETGRSFVENAILKARHASQLSGLPAIADDSGLVVPILGGQPGIYSARYAGPGASDEANRKQLLSDLKDVPESSRKAFFYCVLVFMLNENDPVPLICEGKLEGSITTSPRGDQGFGYDPIFYLTAHKKTAAELTPAVKNTLSHRAIASKKLLSQLSDKL